MKYRKSMSKKRSRKIFKKSASRIHRSNVTGSMRGGYRK